MTTGNGIRKSITDLAVLTVLVMMLLFLFSCKHEPPVIPSDTSSDTTASNGNDTITYPASTCDPDSVYFVNDILPIFISNCAKSGCHNAASQEEGLILDSYSHIMATGEIIPGHPSEGNIMEAITQTDPDDIMPPPPNAPLTAAQIQQLTTWIQQGAQNNSCTDGCDTTAVTYSGTIVPMMQFRCVGCHNSNTTSGNINLTTYSGVALVAANGKLYGAVNRDAGYVAMPQGGPRMPQCEIDQIRIWVDAGAPNN